METATIIRGSIAAWLEIRPASSIAQSMADLATEAHALGHFGARDLSESVWESVTVLRSSLETRLAEFPEPELLLMIPAYLDLSRLGKALVPSEAAATQAGRLADILMSTVAGSPQNQNPLPLPPPQDASFYDWFYHRTSFTLSDRPLEQILEDAYLIRAPPTKVEFRAIDAMRSAYRHLAESARTVADLYRLDSYPTMQHISDEIARRNPVEDRSVSVSRWADVSPAAAIVRRESNAGWGLLPTTSICRPRGRFLMLPRTKEVMIPHLAMPVGPFDATIPAVSVLACTSMPLVIWSYMIHSWATGVRALDPPSQAAAREALLRLAELEAESDGAMKKNAPHMFELARIRLLRIIGAVADVRINSGKSSVRKFIDWAAEATTFSHSSITALACEAARLPGQGIAKFLGASEAERLRGRVRKHSPDSLMKALGQSAATLAELERL